MVSVASWRFEEIDKLLSDCQYCLTYAEYQKAIDKLSIAREKLLKLKSGNYL